MNYEAFNVLCAVTGHAARGALGAGLTREEVASELEALADAIRDPGTVAEDMSPIPSLPRETWASIGVDFSEVG